MTEPTRVFTVQPDGSQRADDVAALVAATPVALPSGLLATLGVALATRAGIGRTAAPDGNVAVLAGDVHVGFTALTAARTVSLPDVDTYPPGQDLVVADESGQCSEARSITVVPGAGTADTIPATSGNSIVLTSPWQSVRLRRGAANVWLIV